MAKHKLILNLPPCTNEGILLIDDISVYDTLLPVSSMNLQITPTGFSVPCSVTPLTSHFRMILTACSMGISGANDCSEMLPNLPDGLWNIRYSVAPNDKVYTEYYYLRTVKAMNRYYKLLCALNLQCCLPDRETEYQLKELDIIHNFILSAKMTVEGDHIPDQGLNQLMYANQLMDKLSRRKPFC